MVNVPFGVPAKLGLPPQPARPIKTTKVPRHATSRSRVFLFLPVITMPTSPRSGNSSAKVPRGPFRSNGHAEAEPPAAAVGMVRATVAVSWLSDGGLKSHLVPAGKPLQLKVIAPKPGLESTVMLKDAAWPAVTVAA